ncbi:phage holin family protein [Emticicia sp. W12TSBA100-4]|uniref:phage holin family protein n=1 Tax=Emticicia sp. W12TSBA100-4 TaxID=3160965 RepID=UPI0033061600
MKPLTALKNVLLLVPDHKDIVGVSSILALCWEFLLKRWELDVIMLPSIIILVAVNTWSGVRRAKFKNEFSKSVLREKTQNKCIGYAIWLICMYVLCLMVVSSIGSKETFFSIDWLHFPISVTYLFIAGVEILSTKANLNETGVKTPTFITDKIEDFVETGKIRPIKEN